MTDDRDRQAERDDEPGDDPRSMSRLGHPDVVVTGHGLASPWDMWDMRVRRGGHPSY